MNIHLPQIITFSKISPFEGKELVVHNNLKNDYFETKRIYWINYNAENSSLSEHANKSIHQIIIPMLGELEIYLENINQTTFRYTLNETNKGLYIPPLFWKRIIYKSPLILLCLASDKFDENDYIRNYQIFQSYQKK